MTGLSKARLTAGWFARRKRIWKRKDMALDLWILHSDKNVTWKFGLDKGGQTDCTSGSDHGVRSWCPKLENASDPHKPFVRVECIHLTSCRREMWTSFHLGSLGELWKSWGSTKKEAGPSGKPVTMWPKRVWTDGRYSQKRTFYSNLRGDLLGVRGDKPPMRCVCVCAFAPEN